jgi:predicted RNA-binding Zn-ribbon protein involved in translation (DUF1610 family)
MENEKLAVSFPPPLPEPGPWNFRECPKCGNKKADIWVDTKGGKIKEHHRCKLCGMHEISW